MINYYLVLVVLTIFACFEIFLNPKFLKPVFIFYGFLILFLFAGLRWVPIEGRYFPDYYNYVKLFRISVPLGRIEEQRFERGFQNPFVSEWLYRFLNSAVHTVTDDPIYLFAVVALIAVGINIYCCKKYSPFPLVSMLLYFSHIFFKKEMGQIRAGLGGALVLLSVLYIQRRQVYRYLIVIWAAIFVHFAAIVALPMYWISRIRFSKKFLYFSIFAALIVSQTGWLKPFLGILDNIGFLLDRVKNYQGVNTSDYALGIFNPLTIKQVVVCLIGIYYKDFLSERLRYFYPLLIMYILSTVWILIFSDFAILAARIATFLSVGDAILLPSLALVFKEKKLVLTANVAFAWMMLYLNIVLNPEMPPHTLVLFR